MHIAKPTKHLTMTGVIGFTPEIREIAKDRLVARFTLGTAHAALDAGGNPATDTQWHTVVAWGETAARVRDEVRRGCILSITGREVTRSYVAKENLKRYVKEIVLADFTVLSTPKRP